MIRWCAHKYFSSWMLLFVLDKAEPAGIAEVQLRITNFDYSEDMADTTSDAYKDFSKTFCQMVNIQCVLLLFIIV